MRKETTSEDRRQEGCQNHDKARARRIAREVSSIQLGIHSHPQSELWTHWQVEVNGDADGGSLHLPPLPSPLPLLLQPILLKELCTSKLGQIIRAAVPAVRTLSEPCVGGEGRERGAAGCQDESGCRKLSDWLLSHQVILLIKIFSGKIL